LATSYLGLSLALFDFVQDLAKGFQKKPQSQCNDPPLSCPLTHLEPIISKGANRLFGLKRRVWGCNALRAHPHQHGLDREIPKKIIGDYTAPGGKPRSFWQRLLLFLFLQFNGLNYFLSFEGMVPAIGLHLMLEAIFPVLGKDRSS